MRECALPQNVDSLETATFLACLATVLEMPLETFPRLPDGEDARRGWTISRWLGGFHIGLVPVDRPDTFSWPGPWIAGVRGGASPRRYVVMYGVPSGVVWDPGGTGTVTSALIDVGVLVAAADIALAMPRRARVPSGPGLVEEIWVARAAGVPAEARREVRAIPGVGLEGDRYARSAGTFPSGPSGSALTLIGREVCAVFSPPLGPDEHRRNVVTSGIDLNGLVGRTFRIGDVACQGVRLCEPCTVIERYAYRPVLRELVHVGGLRADILGEGVMHAGDALLVDQV